MLIKYDMSRNADRKTTRTKSKSVLATAILLEMEKVKEQQQRDWELREKVEELAKTSLQLYQRFQNPSDTYTDTPQLTKKWQELSKAVRKLLR